jgi:hypothetical protein
MEGIGDHKVDSGGIFGLSITVVHFLRETGKVVAGDIFLHDEGVLRSQSY